ncbi:hypothetical protein CN978_30480 [Priestia megaterium]|uniref:hypothetical protein n=1 Tax=Priestia megaterium TaxID=1404 RepID=UPI000BFE8BAB|nr:hypothetical protein [Priestia megaterium]PGN53611.1 hypothetical protein CN978_30480 [Priestia megaterium]PGQ87666.1 hypothetical protein COA18_07500 [Priestia megaterium]
MEKLLYSATSRNKFLALSLLILIFVLMVRYLLLPHFNIDIPIVNKILEDLFSSGFTTVFIAYLVFWLTPKVMNNSNMEVITPYEIREKLKEAREGDEYWYSGGTGRHTRAVTLPEMALASRGSNTTKRLYMQILDPTNQNVLQAYVDYRNRVRTGANNPWSLRRAQNELYATIISVYIWKKEQSLLEFKIALKKEVSLFRFDLSSKLLVITKEDPSEPALFCMEGTFFHKAYKEELRLSLEQSRNLKTDVVGFRFDELDVSNVVSLLNELGIYDVNLDTNSLEEIVELTKRRENPYA